jgi:hypothetical protein
MKVYRLEYAGEYIDTYATDTLAKLRIAEDMLSELQRVEAPEITEINVVMTEDELIEDEVTGEPRKDLGYIVDGGDDVWYRQPDGGYLIYWAEAGDWGLRSRTPDEIRDQYGIQEEVYK